MTTKISRKALRKGRRTLPRPNRFPQRSARARHLALLGLALFVVAGVIIGRKGMKEREKRALGNVNVELQDLVLGLLDSPYADSEGLFRIVPPSGWRIQPRSKESPYNVVFHSPNGPDISILTMPVEDDSFTDLLARIDRIERETGINMHMEISRFKGQKAAQRIAFLHNTKVMALDFALSNVAHHIQFSAHPEVFETYLPAIEDIIDTYEPLSGKAEH